MKRLAYIEDYIELMASHILSWPARDPLIKLARYDEPIVSSMNDQIQRGQGFTDKQAILAHKIVIKYKKQWNTVGYTIEHLDTPNYKLAIRKIDRSQIIDIEDNNIEIRFPYNQELIGHIRAAVQEIPGRLMFNRDRRCWQTALIEPRLIWAKEFGTKYNFSFGPEFNRCLELMLNQEDYAISLRYNGSNFEITNATDSLCDYISEHGGFGTDNLIRLIDLASICGYEISDQVRSMCPDSVDSELLKIMLSRDINIEYDIGGTIDLSAIKKYADLTNRYPIYVYESGSTLLRKSFEQLWGPDQILDLKNSSNSTNHQCPIVYFAHWKIASTNLPLLVTSHTLMIGHRRQQMLQSSQKVIYYSQHIPKDATLSTTDT